MKQLALLISVMLILTACSGDSDTKLSNLNEEFPEEFVVTLEDIEIFEQKSIEKEKNISLISTGDLEGEFTDKEKITLLSNYSNTNTILGIESFIVRTLLNDYKTMEDPTETFKWVLYADSIFVDYLEQMEFDELDRNMRKFYEGINEILIKAIDNRRELVQAWLDYTQGKETKLTIDEIKLNLSEENLYVPSISIGMALATISTEKIGSYDVSNYTLYGHEQIGLANNSVKRMLLKYYEFVKLPSDMTLNDLVDRFKESQEDESSIEKEAEDSSKNIDATINNDAQSDDQVVQNESAIDEIPQGTLNTVETARTQIGYVISYYLDTYAAGDTTSLEYMVHPSSQFYKDQINYMDSLNQRGFVLEVIDYSILSMDSIGKDKYQVTVEEYYMMDDPEKGLTDTKQISKYTVELIDGEFYITDLEL